MYKKYHKDTPVCLHLNDAVASQRSLKRTGVRISYCQISRTVPDYTHLVSGAFEGSLAGDCTIKVEAN